MIDKTLVAQNFSIAADRYDDYAHLQKDLSDFLFDQICKEGLRPKSILDIGCGTGELVFRLARKFKETNVVGIDIASNMVKNAREKNTKRKLRNVSFAVADGEDLPFVDGEFDLVVSSTTFQWMTDLHNAFGQVSRVLGSKGSFYLLTFGNKTLCELRDAFKKAELNKDHITSLYPDIDNIKDLLIEAGFINIDGSRWIQKIWHNNLKDVLKYIKQIGAVYPFNNKSFFGKENYKKIVQEYPKDITKDNKVPASFDVIFMRSSKI